MNRVTAAGQFLICLYVGTELAWVTLPGTETQQVQTDESGSCPENDGGHWQRLA